ncbi:helix-turn-helix domain-containing protein [Mycobacterium marinum]|uniref:helix-turn-helix domain-containing protein n=2 Tax=Mycobacterium marinum TaxID=1781 RepID=UPI000CD905A7|nr:helix-turn-helix domain-containing protein [Mycobacterium marinum]AXN50994.1 Helix-turn-helix domain protein [Mycobacterium marinum]RFZ25409.1 Helix-turn-helix domain protein [Mycobacterium marinum]RFZ28294.1 Helix-turn-helix domain protein [Mycobacterium marinum]RFZ33878.1 Helix-turn-helix domain protein [Mycobacterium marinum]
MHCAMVCHVALHNRSPKSPPPANFIGSAEVARLLEINQVTVARWVTSGELKPVHKLPGKNGAYLFSRADIEKLATERAEASA